MNSGRSPINKKLIIVGLLVLIILCVIAFIIFSKWDSSNMEYTDDSEYITTMDSITAYTSKNHPIASILPIKNTSPFYYISLPVDGDSPDNVSAAIEISYYTKEGKAAAEARLKSSEFSKYHPENYKVIYTQLTDD